MKNPAWTNNTKILEQMCESSRVVASIINFEDAYFSETVASDKPENCMNNIKNDSEKYKLIKKLLDSILLIDDESLPDGAIAWSDMSELSDAVTQRQSSITISKESISL